MHSGRSGHEVNGRAGRGWLCTLIASAALIALGGCTRPRVEAHGKRADVLAAYSVDGLEAKIPPSVSVLAVRSAAEAELRSRGYSIVESRGTEDRMTVRARGSGELRSETTIVTSQIVPRATQVRVESGAFGDETIARAILDGVLVRLGR